MTIAAVCPHCDTLFQLQPDLVGKTIRCPNSDCREPFEVRESLPPFAEPTAPLPIPTPPKTNLPNPLTAINDFLPVIDAEPGLPYERIERESTFPLAADGHGIAPVFPKAKLIPEDDSLPVAKLLPPVQVAKRLEQPLGPKEVDWATEIAGERLTAPPLPTTTIKETVSAEDANEPLLFRRKKSRSVPQLILAGLVVATLFFGMSAVVWWFYVNRNTEASFAATARESYDAGNYAAAGTQYESLTKEYPNSANVPKYSFLMNLSKLRATASSITAIETPGPGYRAYQEFVKEYATHPLAKPGEEGFAREIYETGRLVIDTQAAHAELKIAEFKSDRTKPNELTAAETAVDEGRKLIPSLQPFKEKDSAPLDPQNINLDKAATGIAFERKRLALFAPYRDLIENPTDERIEEFERMLAKNKLDIDAEGQDILDKAKRELRKRVVAVAVSIPAVAAPPEGDPGIAFASAVEKPPVAPGSERKPSGSSEVMFSIARGVLYAHESETGNLLWVCRVSPSNVDSKLVDLPTVATLGEGGQALAVIPVLLGNKPGLTARIIATGEPVWHQPLEAKVLGRPVVLKDRVYIAIKDPNGTVIEFDLATGMRVGQIALRQPIGPGMALFPGSGLLYVPADARRVFVLDVNARDADGKRLPPKCVQILATEHPPGALLCEPVPVGPPGRSSEQRYLVVTQSIDPSSMKLRAFALPELIENQATTDVALAPVAELTVPGWAAYPPTTDGERVAVVTDSGRFAVFGINQQGNLDRAMFALPTPGENEGKRELTLGPVGNNSVRRGQVVIAEEDGFWVVVGGELKRLKVSLDPMNGRTLSDRVLPPRTVGEPLTRGQINSRRDLAVIVVRNPKSFGCRAIGFDPRSGIVKWQRQLGAIPATPLVRLTDGSAVVTDEDGGITIVPANGKAVSFAPGLAEWNAGLGLMNPNGLPLACSSADGGSAWVLSPEQPDKTAMLRIRRISAGKIASEISVALPAKLAGKPLALQGAVLVPLADGIVYRFVEKSSKLLPGPTWKSAGIAEDAICYLASTAKPDEFFGTDGHQKFSRWSWPTVETDAWKAVSREQWEALGAIPFAPIAISIAGRDLVIVADPAGVTAYAANSPSDPILRWKPGKPVRGFSWVRDRVVFAIDGGSIVGINPTEEKVAWELPAIEAGAECVGFVNLGDFVYSTDLLGRVSIIDVAKGSRVSVVSPTLAGLFPIEGVPAIPLNAGRLLLPLNDGTGVYLLVPE